MAFVRVMCKAGKIQKLKRELEEEKKKSYEVSKGQKAKYGIKQTYRHFWIDLRSKLANWLRKKCTFPEHTCIYRTVYKAKRDGTCENFTLKSIIGFISGFFLTYIFFMFFVFILNFKLSTATIMCSFFGSILTIGLAFSYKVRCVVFLLLPQFFSKRGRQALMAYAFILAITGPAKNTLHNMGILSESLACGQEQLKAAVRQIMDVIKKPFYAIRDAIKSVVKTVKVIVKKIKEVLLAIKRTIMAILRVIKAAFQFLGKILNICNKELGTPFQRCTRAFENAITDCNAKLGPLFSWLCSITYLVQAVCYIVKVFDFICMIIDFISDSVIGVVVRKVKIFVRHIRTMFYVRIKFSHSFHFETNQSKSMSEITTGIITEIRHRTENILTVFDFMSCATSMFFLFIILRVLNYRYKFLTSERFDNRFITKDFRAIDMKRAQLEKETVLPLNHRERTLYITVTSMRLVKSEKVKLSKAAVVLGMTTLKLSTHMMADYALYWVLTVIRYHARFQSTVQAPNVVGLHIEGEGFIAKLLKSIVKAFQPLGIKLEIDTVPCLPDPIPPDYDRYIQIASLLILCWILTIFEPYGLRWRHSVMCYYHPTRARQRSIWLYNQIMRSRSSFLKFARRQLRRKVTGAKGITKITLKEYLRANIKFKLFRICLGSDKQDACLLCGEVFRESDPIKPIHCIKPGCPGIYCEQCYADLQNLCTVCMEPIQYGDMSDISEEKDSSGDEIAATETKRKRKKKKCTISKCLKGKDDMDSDDEEGGLLPNDHNDSEKSDSDYSSGSGTDNSYSYQNQKDLTGEPNSVSSDKFSDVEKQRIPDQATWYHFTRHGDSLIEPDSDENSTTESIGWKRNQYAEQSTVSTSTTTPNSNSSIITELEFKRGKNSKASVRSSYNEFGKNDDDNSNQLNVNTQNLIGTKNHIGTSATAPNSNSSLITELELKRLENSKASFRSSYNEFGKNDDNNSNQLNVNKQNLIGTKNHIGTSTTTPNSNSSLITELELKRGENSKASFRTSYNEFGKNDDDNSNQLNVNTQNLIGTKNYIGTSTTAPNSNSSLITELELKRGENSKASFKSSYNKFGKNDDDNSNQLNVNAQNLIGTKNREDNLKHNLSPTEFESISQGDNTKDKVAKCRCLYANRAKAHAASAKNINQHQEDIPLTDIIYHTFSSEASGENSPYKATQTSFSSVTETTFIDTPQKNMSPIVSGTSSSIDSEIEMFQNSGKRPHVEIPKLNLSSDTVVSAESLIHANSSPTVMDRFRKNVKYEVVEERSGNTTSKSSSISPNIPVNMNYQIFVPRYDAFIDCTDLVTVGQKGNNDSSRTKKTMANKISEYKHIQRQKSLADIVERNKLLHANIQLATNSDTDEVDYIQPKKWSTTQNKSNAYSLKVKDYYRKINRNQPTGKPLPKKNQNKFVKFIKRIFGRAKPDTVTSNTPSNFFLGKCDERFVIFSPKSSTPKDSAGTIPSTSSSGDSFLNQHSTETSTGSSSTSLMGSNISHIRGGGESKLENSEQSFTTSTSTEVTTSDTRSGVKQKDEGSEHSDSEISEVDIYFGPASKSVKRYKRYSANVKEPKTTTKLVTKTGPQSATSSSKTESTQMHNSTTIKPVASKEEPISRYLRQPAERDQDSSSQKVQHTSVTTETVKHSDLDTTDMNKLTSDPSSEISPSHAENIRGRSPRNSENINKHYCNRSSPNTNINKPMRSQCPSNEMNPGYIENVQGRYCTCPPNMEPVHQHYSYPNQTPRPPPFYAEETRERRPSTQEYSNNIHSSIKERCRCCQSVRHSNSTEASAQVACEYNSASRYCTCPIQPKNIEMEQQPYYYPNQRPRPPPFYTEEVREHRPSAQKYSNNVRSLSEERRRCSPPVRDSKSSDVSAQVVREYNSASRPPAGYGSCLPRGPKMCEIREHALQYSGGECTQPDCNTKEKFPSNQYSYRNTDDMQYPENSCPCNSFEISGSDANPRMGVDDDALSYCSGCSGRSKFPNLVYQNTDEFYDLVNELGDKLSHRNKERVQKTMREFEIKSSQNRNLEKPILFESDSECKSEANYTCQKPCNCCTMTPYNESPNTHFAWVEPKIESLTTSPNRPTKCGYVEKVVQHMDRRYENETEQVPNYIRSGSNTHWELDTRTGEWYKAYNNCGTYGNEYYNMMPPSPPPFRQMCVRERGPRRYCTRNFPDRHSNYVPPPPRSGKCKNNYTFSQDSPY